MTERTLLTNRATSQRELRRSTGKLISEMKWRRTSARRITIAARRTNAGSAKAIVRTTTSARAIWFATSVAMKGGEKISGTSTIPTGGHRFLVVRAWANMDVIIAPRKNT